MKTHFKKALNTPYMGSQDLPDYKDKNFTIDTVVAQMSNGLKENANFNIAYLKEEGFKPMLLNSTNCKVLSRLTGSPYIEDWTGVEFTVGVEKVKAFGELHDALRIRPVTAASKKPTLNPKSKNWAKITDKVLNEGLSIDSIREHYIISEEDFEQIINPK